MDRSRSLCRHGAFLPTRQRKREADMQGIRFSVGKMMGVAFTVAFTTASVLGTTMSGWYIGQTLVPEDASELGSLPSPAPCLAVLALGVEGLRLMLSLLAERIWRRSPFAAATFATPLWLACATYCALVPLLALAVTPIAETSHAKALAIVAIAWLFIQVAATALPGVAWPEVSHEAADPAMALAPPARVPGATEVANDPSPARAGSPADLYRMLCEVAKLPQGSALPQGGRIGPNQEIVIGHGALGDLTGRSNSTIRRWLGELEHERRVSLIATKRQMRIRVRSHSQAEHVNGHAVPKPAADLLKTKAGAASAPPRHPP